MRDGSAWWAGILVELPHRLAKGRNTDLSIQITKTNSRDLDAGAVSAVFSSFRVIRDNLGTLWPVPGTRRDKLWSGVQLTY
jgi:hypothetical protein